MAVTATSAARRAPKEEALSAAPPDTSAEDHFFWTYTEEPHRTRRQAIIKAHPEVLKLCGHEPLTKYLVLAVVSLQIACAYLLRNTSMLSWQFLVTAYVVGATSNQNLFLAIHEISHNLAFKSPLANRLLAILANLPIGIPYSASFRPYHLTHHKSLGVAGLDADLPTALEAFFLDSLLGKTFFCTCQILFYAVRPMFIYTPKFTYIHLINIVVQISFDIALYKFTNSLQPIYYLILSSFLAGSLHPCAGHFIAEHYFFSGVKTGGTESLHTLRQQKEQSGNVKSVDPGLAPPETYSYYGALNILTYNVGLHNEHHDFPAIPWSRLPKLHEIAKEYYETLPCHRSWVWVIWMFILDKDVGLWCRVKRAEGGRIVGGDKKAAKADSGWTENEIQN